MGDTMRGVHFHLSTSQKKRLSHAQDRFAQLAGSVHSSAFVNVGDTIPVDYESGFLRGHGTQVVDGQLLATLCGVIERVNKLVSVRPFRARYNPETGDVVVGRITEVAPKRWKVDVNSRQDAQLMLSSVNLPGGIQRRRTAVDELNMRDLYTENDLISAEVQALHQDGSLHLHTRSLKYGKLENGQLVKVAPYLIKRLKQHFHQLMQYGVQMILGCNGYVWISALVQSSTADAATAAAADQERMADVVPVETQSVEISREVRERICRLANVVRVLGAIGVLIHPESIIDIYEGPKRPFFGENMLPHMCLNRRAAILKSAYNFQHFERLVPSIVAVHDGLWQDALAPQGFSKQIGCLCMAIKYVLSKKKEFSRIV